MKKLKLPNLIIAGVNKAGTTSLFMYLAKHKDICPSKVKEVQYFLPLRYGLDDLPPLNEYQEQFQCTENNRYVMEATPGYYYGGKKLAQGIVETLGKIKIILLFREPVSRLFSFYKFQKNMLKLDREISIFDYVSSCEALSAEEVKQRENNPFWGIEGGYYADYLESWVCSFGKENIKILFFDDLKNDPLQLLEDLCNWLELDSTDFLNQLDLSIENKTRGFRNAHLQTLALKLNWKAESFWRANPKFKKILRDLYFRINGEIQTEALPKELEDYLLDKYSSHNKRFADLLIQYGYGNLPDWLEYKQSHP